MSKLNPLPDQVEKIFSDCISNIRDENLKAEFLLCTEEIVLDTKEYIDKMGQGTVHDVFVK